MDKSQEMQAAWDRLMLGDKRFYVATGFYALGDAYQITSRDRTYKGEIVLVEHRGKTQYNHWGWRCGAHLCRHAPTITTNGDDGYGGLRRKAPSLKVYS